MIRFPYSLLPMATLMFTKSLPFGLPQDEPAMQMLYNACREIESSFEALYRTARDFEAFNGNFFVLILNEARVRADQTQTKRYVNDIWTKYLEIVESINTARHEHIDRKSSCVKCIQQRWCPCDTEYPDFQGYFNTLQSMFRNAEASIVSEEQQIDLEEAKVMVALQPKCVLRVNFESN